MYTATSTHVALVSSGDGRRVAEIVEDSRDHEMVAEIMKG